MFIVDVTYIGHEIVCDPTYHVPAEQRKPHALVLGKRLLYFYDRVPAWDPSWWEKATIELRRDLHPEFEFIGTYRDMMDDGDIKKLGYHPKDPAGVRNLGKMTASEYDSVIANSRMLVGMGSPQSSPGPYSALCLVSMRYDSDRGIPPGADAIHTAFLSVFRESPFSIRYVTTTDLGRGLLTT